MGAGDGETPPLQDGSQDQAAGTYARDLRSLDRFGFVTPGVRRDLARYVALLSEWQSTHNLVARGEFDAIWSRHVADSLQLVEHAPEGWRIWVDLGSGAGFPGLVVAIVEKGQRRVPPPSLTGEGDRAEHGGGGGSKGGTRHLPPPPRSAVPLPRFAGEDQGFRHVTLVEANLKKAAFLRAAIREIGAPASVAAERIEKHARTMPRRADVVSARALAPLPKLCALAEPYLHERSVLLLLKGQDFVHEVAAASKSWEFDVLVSPSVTNPDGQVAAIRNLRPRT